MSGRNFTSVNGYRYGFNGKEKDDEVNGGGNSLDFGARIYDPRLGKFLSLDPDFYRYPWNSPYAYAINSPIKLVDAEGKGPDVIRNSSSSQIKLTGSTYVTQTVTKDGKTTQTFSGDMAGSIVLNPGDVYYEVNGSHTIDNKGTKTTFDGYGKIVRKDGTTDYVLINDVDYIDVEGKQTFEVDGNTVKNDPDMEIDVNDNKGKRNNLQRLAIEGMPQEDIDGKNETTDDLKNPEKQAKDAWIAKPNKGEIKLNDNVGEVKITDSKTQSGEKSVKVEKGFLGTMETKKK
ncbi:MAG: hypothetical protein A3F72_09615 [Bacteroidetes bacterium RIFCSPLOWO2_12_FULL_35_15]|nr:MAG: hypothetical protein A3F72_09615 [Bacteroidetes bacterium RIFCSPLOWO2_12_FULL_35_15]